MAQALTALLVAFTLAVALSSAFRRSLFWLRSRERKSGKEKIRQLSPKPRRPLGGGLAMALAATIALLGVPLLWRTAPSSEAIWVLVACWAFAAIGLVDDLRKTRGKGLGERQKFAAQVVVAVAFGICFWLGTGRESLAVPFTDGPWSLGVGYVFVAAFLLLASSNAVNLSDGMDGLAGGCLIACLIGLGVAARLTGEVATGAVAWPLVGAVAGFLVLNAPPAKLLMGDTGALGLGAAVGALALLAGVELWLPLLAAPFVVNTASVVLQMGAVRGLWRILRPLRHQRTETARPFLCTPLHHHFQWLAWPEWRILGLYWGFGALMAGWGLASLGSNLLWLLGIAAIAMFLLYAALQKRASGSYFLGLLEQADQPVTVALFRGLPFDCWHWALYRKVSDTTISESMLVGATAESMLWRPLSEVEARVVLGRIYADQRLFEEALREWEQVPTRNILLRPTVALRMARIYYGQDRFLEAIKLWEQLPSSRLAEMPNLSEVVRSAKLRLADLAGKSHRQAMRLLEREPQSDEERGRVEAHLNTARRLNQDLLSLLLYEGDKLRGLAADPEAAGQRRELVRHTREIVLERLRELDAALGVIARTAPPTGADAAAPATDTAQRFAVELGLPRQELMRLLARAGEGTPEVTQVAVHPKASRNSVFRVNLQWPGTGPRSVIAKLYAADRISFFEACYQREAGVLQLLHRWGAAVPQVFAKELWSDRALLLLQDLGDETLADRLEVSDTRGKRQWLRVAMGALVGLQATAQTRPAELAAEIRKTDKDVLGAGYYHNALRIAVGRLGELADLPVTEEEWQQLQDQARPLIDLLCDRRESFLHFEFTPHHLIVTEAGLVTFDLEQATLGPAEFDLATLLAQPECAAAPDSWDELLEHYRVLATEAGLTVPPADELARAVAYAALFKCLVYAGAAANFLGKFGGAHHLHRLTWYLSQCQRIAEQRRPLRPLLRLLAARFRAARSVARRSG